MYNVFINDNYNYNLAPVLFGYESCKKSHHFGPAVRTYWLIHYVVSGYGIYKINNKEYHVKPGEMFIIPPYEETYYEADSKTPWNYIWIGFTGNDEIRKLLKDVIICPEAERIFMDMKNFEECYRNKSAFLTGKLYELISALSEKDTFPQENDYVNQAIACIRSEYMYKITVNDIANRLNIDRTYLSVIFKNKTGISPKQYLINYRLNTAASLLNKHNSSISVIANSVGYSDVYTFSKAFKQHFGITPTKYN